MFAMDYKIKIGAYWLRLLDSVTVSKSVENLADTATIVIPGTHINRAIKVEGKAIEDVLKEGDPVEIWLGYNNSLELEFKGYLSSISTDDAAVRLECVDALYLFKKPVKDREYKTITLNALLNELVLQTGGGIAIACDYSFTWEKFTFFKTTAFDVLKKVQEETRANIYFKDNTLHIHPPYSEITNTEAVIYDFARNIEKSDLKYIRAKDKKVEVEVTVTLPDGKIQKQKYGNPGGTKIQKVSGSNNEADMKRVAESEYSLWVYDGYEGNFTGWLVPFVEPAYKIYLRDRDYTFKNGAYYVVATDVSFSRSGGVRKVTLGRKIG
jgi:hypothetical protein